MPSAVAVLTGLTFQKAGAMSAVDLQDFPRVFLQIVEGGPDASPSMRGADRTMPYRRGQIFGPKRADRLAIQLEGWVAGEGDDEAEQRADTATARQEMFALFDTEAGEGTLTVVTEDGTTWEANAYAEVCLPDAQPKVPTHCGVSVRLIAIDPPNWVATGS
jgi:hypothetical protein